MERVSYVPFLNSSEKDLIEMAGIKNNNTQGANLKNGVKVAKLLLNILLSGKTNRNSPVMRRKIETEMNPLKLLKNKPKSFLQMLHILITCNLLVIVQLCSLISEIEGGRSKFYFLCFRLPKSGFLVAVEIPQLKLFNLCKFLMKKMPPFGVAFKIIVFGVTPQSFLHIRSFGWHWDC